VPSVASEPYAVLPPRPLTPSARSLPEPDAREPAAPFAELLDSAAPAAPPAPRQALTERTERNDPPKDDAGTDAKPVQDSAQETPEAKDSEATPGNEVKGVDAKSVKDATAARPPARARQRTTTARPRTAISPVQPMLR
jgi:hypothetical protein